MALAALRDVLLQGGRDYYNRSEEDRRRALALEDEARRRQDALKDRDYWDQTTRERNATGAREQAEWNLEFEKKKLLDLSEQQKRVIARDMGVEGWEALPLGQLDGLIRQANDAQVREAAMTAAKLQIDVTRSILPDQMALDDERNAPARAYATEETGRLDADYRKALEELSGLQTEAENARQALLKAVAGTVPQKELNKLISDGKLPKNPTAEQIVMAAGKVYEFQAGNEQIDAQLKSKAQMATARLSRAQSLLQASVHNARQVQAPYWNAAVPGDGTDAPPPPPPGGGLDLSALGGGTAPPSSAATSDTSSLARPVPASAGYFAPPSVGKFAPPVAGRGAYLPGPSVGTGVNPLKGLANWYWSTPEPAPVPSASTPRSRTLPYYGGPAEPLR
jgi:hypothetical protein